MRIVIPFFLSITLSLFSQEITIGSKNFTEQLILGEIFAQTIESNSNIKVNRKFYLGGSYITFETLKNGDIDLYPEYTGTGLMLILNEPMLPSAKETLEKVKHEFKKKYNLIWLEPLGFENKTMLATTHKGIKNISDLSQLNRKLSLAAPHEFLQRSDGFPILTEVYQLPIEMVLLDPGLMYTAIANGDVDLITAFSTDARIKNYDLHLLEDDKNAFPSYEATPLIRKETLTKYPELEDILNKLNEKISIEEMRNLNYQVDIEGLPHNLVVKMFLESKEIIPITETTILENNTLFNYFWNNRWYLLELIREHLFLCLTALIFAILVGLPLGILITHYENLSTPIFLIVNTIQTIPSLALLGFIIPIMGIGVKPAIFALFLYALLPIIRNTYTGIREIDPEIIESSRGVGLTNFQILTHVEIPLAYPLLIAGIRTSTVIIIGTATLASLIGAGGLGDPIFQGISSVQTYPILLGAIPAALLAIILDQLLGILEKRSKIE